MMTMRTQTIARLTQLAHNVFAPRRAPASVRVLTTCERVLSAAHFSRAV